MFLFLSYVKIYPSTLFLHTKPFFGPAVSYPYKVKRQILVCVF